jgi:hypothetical protein
MHTQEELQVFDHDWPSLAEGVVIPYGLYDLLRNAGNLLRIHRTDFCHDRQMIGTRIWPRVETRSPQLHAARLGKSCYIC